MSKRWRQPPICAPASAHKDHETVALIGHRSHISTNPRKMKANFPAKILLVVGTLPFWHVMSAKQPFHVLRIEKAAEFARLRLTMQTIGTTAAHALTTQEQIAERARGAHIPDRHKVKQA